MKRLLSLLLMLLLSCHAAMAESSVYRIDGKSADRVHLRLNPTIEAESLGLYYTGTDVIVIDWYDEWAWVMVGDVTGYIMSEYLTEEYTADRAPWYVVDNPNDTWVNLRMSPTLQGMVVMCPENGTRVQVLGETSDGWSYVDCGGVKGYIMTKLLTEAPKLERTGPQAVFLAQDGLGSGRSIYQYTAPNGQQLYFTASVSNPLIEFVDVDFDGIDDIVVMIDAGTSNAYYTFFVYHEAADEYYRVDCDHTDTGLANYQLYPELGIVMAYGNNGSAGAMHEYVLFTWEDGYLKHLRSASSVSLSEYGRVPGGTTVTTWYDRVRIVVWDCSTDEAVILFEEIITLEDAEYRDVFNEEWEALWQGLR